MRPLATPVAEVGARAKRDLAPGEKLGAIGEYCYRGFALAENARADVLDDVKANALASGDPLLWDYVEALKASPGTPSAVKKELASLFTNPAFRYQGAPDNK